MALTSGDYEAQANRLRSRMTQTADELRSNLTPKSLALEAASRAGITDLLWRGAVDFASTRHPAPLPSSDWASCCGCRRRLPSATEKAPTMLPYLCGNPPPHWVDTATRVFRERAATKQREFLSAAQTHVEKGASMLSDVIEQKLEGVIDRVPGGSEVRPFIESTVQIAVATGLEALLQR